MKQKQTILSATLAVALLASGAGALAAHAQTTTATSSTGALGTAYMPNAPGGTPPSMIFTRDLTIGDTGNDVMALQQFLNANDYPITIGGVQTSTGYFGTATQSALAEWQNAHAISPADGYLGPISRSALNAMATYSGNANVNTNTMSSGNGSGSGQIVPYPGTSTQSSTGTTGTNNSSGMNTYY